MITLEFDNRFTAQERKDGSYAIFFNYKNDNRFIGYVPYLSEDNILGNTIKDYTKVIEHWEQEFSYRGGARPGAGRKTIEDEKLDVFSCRLKKDTIAKIDAMAEAQDKTRREIIEALLS